MEVYAGASTGVTLSTQVYLGRGEIMAKVGEPQPEVSNRIRVNIFWMGKSALRMGRDYFLKLGTSKVPVRLHHINYLIDASENGRDHDPDRVERHDVADCILQLRKPIAFDAISSLEGTGRFVLVDQYEIAGGGIIREALPADDAEEAKDSFSTYTILCGRRSRKKRAASSSSPEILLSLTRRYKSSGKNGRSWVRSNPVSSCRL